jgi:hypothetical protein
VWQQPVGHDGGDDTVDPGCWDVLLVRLQQHDRAPPDRRQHALPFAQLSPMATTAESWGRNQEMSST